jgi:hypothetical protein
MGLAVNDHTDIAGLVVEYWEALPAVLREQLGDVDDVRALNDQWGFVGGVSSEVQIGSPFGVTPT